MADLCYWMGVEEYLAVMPIELADVGNIENTDGVTTVLNL